MNHQQLKLIMMHHNLHLPMKQKRYYRYHYFQLNQIHHLQYMQIYLPKKKLIAGIVLTGGGSQLKHLKQLVEYITGMDTRVGYPNEHLAGDSDPQTTSPTFSTAVGLLMNALENAPTHDEADLAEEVNSEEEGVSNEIDTQLPLGRKSIFEKWTDKFKEFLDKA